ncbi:MAG: ABC transporter substrate-binding protein [Firmicutes bacterium]|nr:ABC transporter substrate-binding protein [Bacillota bacterium]MCL5040256.1 ABC transporter substrate-binding protein [Bacillota bacterium]
MRKQRFLVFLLLVMFIFSLFLGGCASSTTEKKAETPAPQPVKKLAVELLSYPNPRPYNPVGGDRLAQAIQADLAKVGIEVKIVSQAWKEHLKSVDEGKGDAFLLGWIGDNGDPDNFLYMLLHSSQIETTMNAAHYKNPDVDRLLSDAQKIADPAKRYDLYKKAQEVIVKDAPWVFFNHGVDMVAMRKNITGYQLHPTGWVNLQPVDKEGAKGEKVLIYARGADSVKLDPALPTDGESAKVMNNIYDNLVRYKPGSTDVEPALAESWKVSDDGKVWTFNLRKNVKFHDGTPFNAEAVKFNIERQLPPKVTKEMAYADFTYGMIEKVEAVDANTVKITLKSPYAPFLANLAMGLAAPMISPTAAKKYGENFSQNPVGTGPFIFVKWDKEQQIVLKANKAYWGGAPKVDRVIFKVVKENAVRANELLTGSADIIDGVDPNDVPRLQQDSNVRLLTAPGMNINYLGIRTDKKPFDDPRIRQAISMAINREAIVKSLYQDKAILANGPLPPNLFGYYKDLKPYSYDPEKAKALLKEAGY